MKENESQDSFDILENIRNLPYHFFLASELLIEILQH